MSNEKTIGLDEYNSFCKVLEAGMILYNLDSTNLWGDYLLVASVSIVRIGNAMSYVVLLIGLKKEEGKYVSRNFHIQLTYDYANITPFLKPVGYCSFFLQPVISDININVGLVTVYANTDLHKYTTKLSISKPRRRKYGKDGNLIIKKNNV